MSKIPRFVNDAFNNAENDASNAMDAGYYTFTGSYCEQKFNKALHYFILANKLGHIDAINYIYLCYIILNKENTNESLKRLEENAYKGNSVACDILFNLYYEGKYVQKDISKAILFKELYIENTQYNQIDEYNELINICKENNVSFLKEKISKYENEIKKLTLK